MASVGAIWGPTTLRFLRVAVSRTATAFRAKVANASKPHLEPIPIRTGPSGRQPIHPAAFLKQSKRGARFFSSGAAGRINNVVRRYFSSESPSATGRFDRSKFPSSKTSRRVAQFSGRAPFASTLRPNLTGGAMPRTAGGYSLGGGGARYFSHTPAAPAQVVQNVSQAMRAFFLSGQKLRYDGLGPRGERQYRAVSDLEDQAMHKLASIARNAPGAFIDFKLSPTLTALSPLAAVISAGEASHGFKPEAFATSTNLNTDGFLDVLSADFGRALQDLTSIYADLRRLAVLGDLPITLENNKTALRVRFPGVDAETVNRLCDDIGIQRGIVDEDPGLEAAIGVPTALKFPFAPESPLSLELSVDSFVGNEYEKISSLEEDDSFIHEAFAADSACQLQETDGYESMSPPVTSSGERVSADFEGLEGIYRFIEECDRGRGRLG